jgi:CheY-like chemotaxis protein
MIHPASEAVPSTTAEPLKVLVVDDDEDVRTIVELAVGSLGHSCRVASDGLEALEMHTHERADVILSDWTMPRMDGLELCLKIRAGDPARAYTHFIFFTGNSGKAHSREGMRAGADDYLFKPIDIDQLEARFAVARRVLSLHRELRDNRAGATPSK